MLSVKNTYIAVCIETTPDELKMPTNADFLLADADYSFEAGFEELERNVISGSLDALEKLQGMQTSKAGLTVEMRGSGTRKTAPEYDPLLQACFDAPLNPLSADAAVLAGSTKSAVKIAAVAGLTAGNLIKINVAPDGQPAAYEYALITGVTGTTEQTLALMPELSAVPFTGAAVLGGLTYRPKSSGHVTLSVHLFLDCDGQDGLWYRFAGCRPNMSLANVSTGSIPKVKFDLTPTSWSVVHAGSNLTTLGLLPDPDLATEPPICLGCVITLGSQRELIHTQNMEMDLGLEMALRKSMIPDSGIRSSKFSKRAVTGKFDLDLDDDTQYLAWKARQSAPLLTVIGKDNGNSIVSLAPYMKRTGVQSKDTDGVWTQDITWAAGRTNAIQPIYFGFF